MKRLLIVCSLVAALPCVTFAVDFPIPDTGQTKCYDNDSEEPCPASGQPFYGQDAQYSTNPQSYTQLDASGNDMPFSADYSTTPWAMVRDNVTGLIWEVKDSKDVTLDYENPHWKGRSKSGKGGGLKE